jgi:hypothetical protein
MKKVRSKNNQAKTDVSTSSSAIDTSPYSNMLTIEELKSFPGCENIDDKEAEKIIQSLYELSLLTYEVFNK